MDELVDALGALRVLQGVLAQIAQGRAAPAGNSSCTSWAVAAESTTWPPWAVAVSRAQRSRGAPK
jgi:hypothetical protein